MQRARITTDEADRLLDGAAVSAHLELAAFVAALRSDSTPLDPDMLAQTAAQASEAASVGANAPVHVPAAASGRWLGIRRRAVTAMTVATLTLGSGAAAAVAADGAAPGDALYGLDRALENMGVGNGGAQERLEEVRELVEKGQLARGLEHTPQVVAANQPDPAPLASEATDALRAAAQRISALADRGAEAAHPDVSDAVSDLLTYLSEHIGEVDGQRVAELAQLVGEAAREDRQPPDNLPAGQPDGRGGPRP